MSGDDGESFMDLPKVGLKAIKVARNEKTDSFDLKEEEKEKKEKENEEECHTPTSAQHKIPPALICPPAPKKPRTRSSRASSCNISQSSKRNFFEFMNLEEVDMFFQSTTKKAARRLSHPMVA